MGTARGVGASTLGILTGMSGITDRPSPVPTAQDVDVFCERSPGQTGHDSGVSQNCLELFICENRRASHLLPRVADGPLEPPTMRSPAGTTRLLPRSPRRPSRRLRAVDHHGLGVRVLRSHPAPAHASASARYRATGPRVSIPLAAPACPARALRRAASARAAIPRSPRRTAARAVRHHSASCMWSRGGSGAAERVARASSTRSWASSTRGRAQGRYGPSRGAGRWARAGRAAGAAPVGRAGTGPGAAPAFRPSEGRPRQRR